MIKKWLFFFSAAALLTLTSCFEMIEEVYLNKDGSGKYLVTIDMSELFGDDMMKSLMEEAAGQQTGGDGTLEIDSIVRFAELPNAAGLSEQDKSLLKPLVMHMNMSESQGKMIIRMEYPFKNIDDIRKMGEALAKVEGEEGNPMMGGPTGLMKGNQASFTLNKKVLSRLPTKMDNELVDSENMEFAKMFLESAKYRTIYHLPGKVKKTSIPNAKVEGSTVTVENGMLDIIEGKAKLDGDIKFK